MTLLLDVIDNSISWWNRFSKNATLFVFKINTNSLFALRIIDPTENVKYEIDSKKNECY